MKHAYLIMAHHEFEVLGKLVQAIDDKRNDIFIHFDAKLKSYPVLKAHNANLYILEKRIDIHWGHISQIKAEYALFETAFTQDRYAYPFPRTFHQSFFRCRAVPPAKIRP